MACLIKMEVNSYKFITTLFIVLIGLLACIAEECNKKSITDCYIKNSVMGCPDYCEFEDCIDNLTGDCTGEDLKVFNGMKEVINGLDGACPGLPKTTCFTKMTKECMKPLPYNITFTSESIKLTDIEKEEACKAFQFQVTKTTVIKCLEKLRKPCPAEYTQKRLNLRTSVVKDLEKRCDNILGRAAE